MRNYSHKKPLKYVKHFVVKPNAQKIKCLIIELHSHSELLKVRMFSFTFYGPSNKTDKCVMVKQIFIIF